MSTRNDMKPYIKAALNPHHHNILLSVSSTYRWHYFGGKRCIKKLFNCRALMFVSSRLEVTRECLVSLIWPDLPYMGFRLVVYCQWNAAIYAVSSRLYLDLDPDPLADRQTGRQSVVTPTCVRCFAWGGSPNQPRSDLKNKNCSWFAFIQQFRVTFRETIMDSGRKRETKGKVNNNNNMYNK